MATYRRIPEIVDARQFTGGAKNGLELVHWVDSNEGKAFWNPEISPIRNNPEHIRVYENHASKVFEVAYIGDHIMQRQDGRFEVVRQQELDSDFEIQ